MKIEVEFESREDALAFMECLRQSQIETTIEAVNEAAGLIIGGFLVTYIVGASNNIFSAWLYDRMKEYRAKRIRVNQKEPVDRAEFQHVVSDTLDIGKND